MTQALKLHFFVVPVGFKLVFVVGTANGAGVFGTVIVGSTSSVVRSTLLIPYVEPLVSAVIAAPVPPTLHPA